MAYEMVVELDPVEAQNIIDLYDEEGAVAAVWELELYHWYGHHPTFEDHELCFTDDVTVLDIGTQYIGWICRDTCEAGLLYKIPH